MALEAVDLTFGRDSEITHSSAAHPGGRRGRWSPETCTASTSSCAGDDGRPSSTGTSMPNCCWTTLEIPWLAMRGEFERVDLLIADIVRLGERMSLGHFDDALNGALAMRMVWKGESEPILGLIRAVESSALPLTTVVAALWCRLGRFEEARSLLAEHEDTLVADLSSQTWFSPMMWAMGAEAAAHLGRPDLAAASYSHLVELRGRPACAGSGTCLGPADAFLALAAHATGERDLATSHARDAARCCEEWRVPLAAQWFAGVRETFGF